MNAASNAGSKALPVFRGRFELVIVETTRSLPDEALIWLIIP
jgi:hypothetical protein